MTNSKLCLVVILVVMLLLVGCTYPEPVDAGIDVTAKRSMVVQTGSNCIARDTNTFACIGYVPIMGRQWKVYTVDHGTLRTNEVTFELIQVGKRHHVVLLGDKIDQVLE